MAPEPAGLGPLSRCFGATSDVTHKGIAPAGWASQRTKFHHLRHPQTGLAPHCPRGRQPSLLWGPAATSHDFATSHESPCSVNTQPRQKQRARNALLVSPEEKGLSVSNTALCAVGMHLTVTRRRRAAWRGENTQAQGTQVCRSPPRALKHAESLWDPHCPPGSTQDDCEAPHLCIARATHQSKCCHACAQSPTACPLHSPGDHSHHSRPLPTPPFLSK